MSSTGQGRGEAAVAMGIIRPEDRPSEREKFLAVSSAGPLLLPDALVVLCGEDWGPRLDFAMGQYVHMEQYAKREGQAWAPHIVLSGGKHEPPRWISAEKAVPKMIGKGVQHSRILVDNQSQNTRDQAVNTLDIVMEQGWRRIMLIASAYHMPRAFLTFLKEIQTRNVQKVLEVNPGPVDFTLWTEAPKGMEPTRLELLGQEFVKVVQYGRDIATWTEGLEYLAYWETHGHEQQEVA